jgi:hypothetical protein
MDGAAVNVQAAKSAKAGGDDEELVSAEPDIEEEMRRLMGFSSFDSTHVCHAPVTR